MEHFFLPSQRKHALCSKMFRPQTVYLYSIRQFSYICFGKTTAMVCLTHDQKLKIGYLLCGIGMLTPYNATYGAVDYFQSLLDGSVMYYLAVSLTFPQLVMMIGFIYFGTPSNKKGGKKRRTIFLKVFLTKSVKFKKIQKEFFIAQDFVLELNLRCFPVATHIWYFEAKQLSFHAKLVNAKQHGTLW